MPLKSKCRNKCENVMLSDETFSWKMCNLGGFNRNFFLDKLLMYWCDTNGLLYYSDSRLESGLTGTLPTFYIFLTRYVRSLQLPNWYVATSSESMRLWFAVGRQKAAKSPVFSGFGLPACCLHSIASFPQVNYDRYLSKLRVEPICRYRLAQ